MERLPFTEGQLISKCFLGIFNPPKKLTKKLDFTTYYGTSSRIVFVHFLGEVETPKRHLEINWPLDAAAVSTSADGTDPTCSGVTFAAWPFFSVVAVVAVAESLGFGVSWSLLPTMVKVS